MPVRPIPRRYRFWQLSGLFTIVMAIWKQEEEKNSRWSDSKMCSRKRRSGRMWLWLLSHAVWKSSMKWCRESGRGKVSRRPFSFMRASENSISIEIKQHCRKLKYELLISRSSSLLQIYPHNIFLINLDLVMIKTKMRDKELWKT